MEKKLLRIEKEKDNYNYIYEELVPQETTTVFSEAQHLKNTETAQSRKATITEEIIKLKQELQELNDEQEKIQKFLDREIKEVEPEEEESEEEDSESEE